MYITISEYETLEKIGRWSIEKNSTFTEDEKMLFSRLDEIIIKQQKARKEFNEKQKELMRYNRQVNPKYYRWKG